MHFHLAGTKRCTESKNVIASIDTFVLNHWRSGLEKKPRDVQLLTNL